MEKLAKLFFASVLGIVVWSTPAAVQAQTLPPWMNKRTETTSPQSSPQQYPTTRPAETRTDENGRTWDGDRAYPTNGNRKGHPHGMPPGQAKKMNRGYGVANNRRYDDRRYDDRRYDNRGYDDRRDNRGYDNRRYDERRDDRGYNDRRDDDRRYDDRRYDHDDHHDKDHGKKGKYKYKKDKGNYRD